MCHIHSLLLNGKYKYQDPGGNGMFPVPDVKGVDTVSGCWGRLLFAAAISVELSFSASFREALINW